MNKFHCLLINLGSPVSADERGVAAFLGKFLMDKYVIQIPYLLRAIVVNIFIIPKRKSRSAALYRKVWLEDGSPIIVNSERIKIGVERELRRLGSDVEISTAMRHGENSIKERVLELYNCGVRELYAIALYPQYEKSTYLSSIEETLKWCRKLGVKCSFFPPFFDRDDYIEALSSSIREKMDGVVSDKIIFSYHSIPLSYLPCGEKCAKRCCCGEMCEHGSREFGCNIGKTEYCGDCYKFQCFETTMRLCNELQLDRDRSIILFQSKMGHKEWLSPSLDNTLKKLPNEGVKSVVVISPSFVADCLETLYEIDILGRETFIENGGEEFYYISALNDNEKWTKTVASWIVNRRKI